MDARLEDALEEAAAASEREAAGRTRHQTLTLAGLGGRRPAVAVAKPVTMTPQRCRRLHLALTAAALHCAALAACRQAPICHFCQMVVPEETRTVVEVSGERRLACDPRCVLTYERQTGRQVRFVESTDFDTRRPIDPARAWYVSGSDIAPDASAVRMRASPETTVDLHWHRCLPSVLAFATREAAERFQRAHGGQVETLARLREQDVGRPRRPAG